MANSSDVLIRLDGIKWWIVGSGGARTPVPLCPKHDLRLKPVGSSSYSSLHRNLECAECDRPYPIPRTYGDETKYVLDKIDSKAFRKMKTINLDDEAVPLAEERGDLPKASPYWIVTKMVESKTGRRLLIYAGRKGRIEKTQIFVEPDIKRLSFDHNDHHPSDIFVKVEVTFDSGLTSTIEKKASPGQTHSVPRVPPPIDTHIVLAPTPKQSDRTDS
jgi:hypothetical protein